MNRLREFDQIDIFNAAGDKYELTKFWGQKVKGQGHNMTTKSWLT